VKLSGMFLLFWHIAVHSGLRPQRESSSLEETEEHLPRRLKDRAIESWFTELS
jgi:hypothetical protein